ncbi:hypothetical protein SETIT_1G162900v2 [Setaria italica]|uniref:non-specific serine/threonine protein kinase n=1 Tax=Setaria italica TaxID=4555 RepID=K3YQA9_SETIT|nr:probable L-type lectin-domain containing receptor kinase S.5 [Setaria italica]RCV06446.1 hypothetical protein SETIT_1G162900v2 [Setaria italica]
MGPSRRGNDGATTSLALLLLLSSVFICSQSIQLPKSTIYNTTVAGKQFTTFYFTDFDGKQQLQQPGILIFSSNSSISQGALQITPDTGNAASSFLVNQTGRVFFPSPFALWAYMASSNSPDGKHIASFNTSFMFNLFRTNLSIKGEGLTFLIASGNDEPPPGSYGGYLGLTNASTDGRATNGFVAVELDTVKQSYDPDDNHVGLNVNGVRSTYATPLAPHGIQLAPTNISSGTYNAWVEYDGTTRHISVYMSADESKPATAVLNASVDLSRILLGRKAFFGFSASTGVHYQLNCVLQWMMTVETLDDNDNGSGAKKTSSGWKASVITGVSCGALTVTLGLLAALLYIKKKRKKDREGTISLFNNTIGLMTIPGLPKVFDYKELSKGTNDFDEKMKLGQGGYGVVYRATVPMKDGDNMEVAVKRFSGANTKGQEDFLAELSIINRLRHRNLVKLVGWCHHNGVLMLVYDYMPNGSLDKHIFGGKDAPALNWDQRYNVVAGIASALNYVHHEYDQMVVHRDIKPSNIMLDSSFNARLGDFGLARALESGKSSYTDMIGVPGTLGYIAPECFHTGRATRESDVFAFGAVILEIVCGRRISCNSPGGFGQLLEWVWRLHGERRVLDAVDPRLAGEFDEEDAERLLLLGLACSHPNAGERPKTKAIMQNLTRSVPPFAVPLARPAFMWPVGLDVNVDEDAETTQMSHPTATTTMVVEVDPEIGGEHGAPTSAEKDASTR